MSNAVWPMYFAKRALNAPRVVLKEGQPFPLQSKHYIRGLGFAYGVKDPERVDFFALPYVEVLDVRSQEMAEAIMERGLDLKAAKRLLASEPEQLSAAV